VATLINGFRKNFNLVYANKTPSVRLFVACVFSGLTYRKKLYYVFSHVAYRVIMDVSLFNITIFGLVIANSLAEVAKDT